MHTLTLGIDIGSTTAKVVLAEGQRVLYEKYERHYSRVREKTLEMLRDIHPLVQERPFCVAVSGSAGLGLAQEADLPFVQEVHATAKVVRLLAPDTSMVVELGGEDAKVIFLQGGLDERMNGSCAGGTGAFIDQMAVLLNMTVEEMDAASLRHERIYPIASRCGVFAKSDIQPLLNQGASKADIAASIYQAVVNQTLTGLIQGRRVEGKVMFLGGPLHYCAGLRERFVETMGLSSERALFPEYGRFSVAFGAALHAASFPPTTYGALIRRLMELSSATAADRLPPLFESEADYAAFAARHARATVEIRDLASYAGRAWLGVDCGSTTTKLALIAEDKNLLYQFYAPNQGDPVRLVRDELAKLRALLGDRVRICGAAATGYGEELVKHAFHMDEGVVETIAHYTAARHFQPDVDFILDIGGQDIKCFKIANGAIDSIMLNEACSSGCGSFIETFAKSMGCDVADFALRGLRSRAPVNLGSRCTVFMNSSVKQSQKDGASVEDISAGLSISVVKNAVYKVIRANAAGDLGERIVVQGGTFLNNAVLRAFEMELGAPVIRPSIAGLMGAYGAALHAMRFAQSRLLSLDELNAFTHQSRTALCNGCENHCHLTVNLFADGKRYISGNQCQKALGVQAADETPNLHAWKREYLASLKPVKGPRGRLGLPLALGTYELAPLWHALFTALGFEVILSGPSNRALYEKGQYTIPSDTVCYPAKLMHGHVAQLLDMGVETLFYPSLTYNVDEGVSDNHFNCPVVAYYAELLNANVDALKSTRFLYPYLDVGSPHALARTLYPCLHALDASLSRVDVLRACRAGFHAYRDYHAALRAEGERALAWARANGRRVMILAGRPYHIDPEIGHGVDKLAASLGFAVVSEDAVCHLAPAQRVHVLNQWTFHARLYRAARYAAEHPNTELVQLVSFGCGVDAITADEVRAILEGAHKYYTQIKIDEIVNLGAVRIRLRSLLGALEEGG